MSDPFPKPQQWLALAEYMHKSGTPYPSTAEFRHAMRVLTVSSKTGGEPFVTRDAERNACFVIRDRIPEFVCGIDNLPEMQDRTIAKINDFLKEQRVPPRPDVYDLQFRNKEALERLQMDPLLHDSESVKLAIEYLSGERDWEYD